MQGFYTVYNTHSSRPPFSLPQQDQESLAWASTLTAAMPYQVAFALEPPKYSGPQGIAAFGRFARAAEVMKGMVLNDLAATQLSVNVSSPTGPIIARIYSDQPSVSAPPANRTWCAVLVVVSGQGNFSKFKAVMDREAVPGYVAHAFTMLPFSAYSVTLANATSDGGGESVVLEDYIAPNAVSFYRLSALQGGNALGCPHPRPR